MNRPPVSGRRLVAERLTDRGIGERLWSTPKTVETHVRHILRKLGMAADSLHNRRVLVVLAYLEDTVTAALLRDASPTAATAVNAASRQRPKQSWKAGR